MSDAAFAQGAAALLARAQRLIETPADLRLIDELSADSANWLVIEYGQRDADVVSVLDAFALYLDRCEADARLLIVRTSPANNLQSNIAERDLSAHVTFLDGAEASVAKAAYLCADAMLCIGDGAALDATLVQALIIGTPIVAAASPPTALLLGDAGLVWSQADAALIAAAVERVRKDTSLRAALRANGFDLLRSAAFREALEVRPTSGDPR